jgi:SAM-dependent methyltransferase
MDDQRTALPQHALPRGLAGRIMYFLMNRGHGAVYTNVAEMLAPQPDDDLLEVACGNGYFLERYASQVRSLAGLDLSEIGIRSAVRRHAERIAAGTAELVCGDATRLPWEDERFTAVTSMGSLPGLPQPAEALKEMYRVLRPGGRVVFSIEWNAEDGRDHSKEQAKSGYQIWTGEEVRGLMKEAGFSDVTITYKSAMGMPKMMLVRAFRSPGAPQARV